MKAEFLTPLIVVEINDGSWQLTRPFMYDSIVYGSRIIVPRGFVTDFASVPRVPFAYWLTGDTAHKASVIHDFLYRTKPCARSVADAVFLEAMGADGQPLWRRKLMWLGVRLFGEEAYDNEPPMNKGEAS